jgi:hypothetical protein
LRCGSVNTAIIIELDTPLWIREGGKVSRGYCFRGIDNSSCLLFESNRAKDWLCSHNKFVEVVEGDIFSFEGSFMLEGKKISAYAGVSTFDKEKQAIKWNSISEKVNNSHTWIRVKKIFIIFFTFRYCLLSNISSPFC